jgi:chromosome partitioning protein
LTQGSLTESFGINKPDELDRTLATMISDFLKPDDNLSRGCDGMAFHESERNYVKPGTMRNIEGVDLIPGNIELAGLEVSMVNVMSRETILRELLQDIREEYDTVLIDCSPILGMLTINALVAADSVLIPLQVAYLPAKGLEQLLLTINKVRRQLNRKLMIEGILFSMVDMRTNFSRDYVALIEEAYGSKIRIFNARIPFSVRAAEASAAGVSIFMHDAKGKVAASYRELTREVLANGD